MSMTDQDRAFARRRFYLWAAMDVVLLTAISVVGLALHGFFGLWMLADPPQRGESILSGPMLAWLAGAGALGLMPAVVAPLTLWWRYRQFKRQHPSG
jgi:sterol desaturase/sphingolipid hydroxylase (fatty acid hydroxylase superfamily)